jgi:hypothetical protein
MDDEARAWAAFVTNVLVLPGLGSLLVGRREGWLQVVLALVGTTFTLVWLFAFVRLWLDQGYLPLEDAPGLGSAVAGLALFGLSWLWALISSVAVLRRARRS